MGVAKAIAAVPTTPCTVTRGLPASPPPLQVTAEADTQAADAQGTLSLALGEMSMGGKIPKSLVAEGGNVAAETTGAEGPVKRASVWRVQEELSMTRVIKLNDLSRKIFR